MVLFNSLATSSGCLLLRPPKQTSVQLLGVELVMVQTAVGFVRNQKFGCLIFQSAHLGFSWIGLAAPICFAQLDTDEQIGIDRREVPWELNEERN